MRRAATGGGDGESPAEAGLDEEAEEARGILSVRLYSPSSCRSIIDRAAAASTWAEAEVLDPVAGGARCSKPDRDSRSARVLTAGDNSDLVRGFDERLRSVVGPLVKRAWPIDLADFLGTQLIRYEPGGYYRPHSDEIGGPVRRYFSILCYLNDDFVGGRTVFPALNYWATPQTGKAIIFPASYPHYAEPVTAGEKYVIVSWLTGRPPVRWL